MGKKDINQIITHTHTHAHMHKYAYVYFQMGRVLGRRGTPGMGMGGPPQEKIFELKAHRYISQQWGMNSPEGKGMCPEEGIPRISCESIGSKGDGVVQCKERERQVPLGGPQRPCRPCREILIHGPLISTQSLSVLWDFSLSCLTTPLSPCPYSKLSPPLPSLSCSSPVPCQHRFAAVVIRSGLVACGRSSTPTGLNLNGLALGTAVSRCSTMALGIPSLHLWTLTSWVGFISKGVDGPLQLWT